MNSKISDNNFEKSNECKDKNPENFDKLKDNNENSLLINSKSKLFLGVFDLIALNIGTGLIIIFTLGLGYPIAAVIKEKYIKDRTIISNRKIVFSGSAGDLYITYIKWMILVVITFGIYLFWLNRNILRWKVSNTNFVDKKDNETESFFDGTVSGLFITNLLTLLLIIFTLGVATPWAISYKSRYINSHTVINGHRLGFKGTGTQLFGKFIGWILLSIVTFGIYLIWLGLNMLKWEVENVYINKQEPKLEIEKQKINKAKISMLKLEKVSTLIGVISLLVTVIFAILDSLRINILLGVPGWLIMLGFFLGISISSLLGFIASINRIKTKNNLTRGVIFTILSIILFIVSTIIIIFFINSGM